MPVNPSTRDKLRTAGTSALAAALARRGLPARRIEGLHPLDPLQDPLIGEACLTFDHSQAGAVLVVELGRPMPPLALLARRGLAGIVSGAPLRDAAGIVRGGLPAYQQRAGSATPLSIVGGDVLVGDRQGVIAIPAALVDEIAEEATEALAFEAFTAEQVDAGGGVYGLHIASGEQARIAFAAWRKLKGR